ncbi:MAG: hypothetical protein F6J86_30180 [Symploca sp. SIO1B1]|nr:hypothetical protein [Symploca sp. SIO1B1]
MKVSLELPDIVDVDQRYLMEALVAMLYFRGKLSEHQACQTLNINRRDFEEMLPHYGLSILGDSQENLDIELTARLENDLQDTNSTDNSLVSNNPPVEQADRL